MGCNVTRLFFGLLITAVCLVEAQRGKEIPFYLNSEDLLEISSNNIDQLVFNSSYVTLLEFYAPWCGYCKQLKPGIEKLGQTISKKNLPVQIGIVNCDDSSNAKLCGEYNIEGFPTLLTVAPKSLKKIANSEKINKKNYNIDVYKGAREVGPILKHLVSKTKKELKFVKEFQKLYAAITAEKNSKKQKPFVLQLITSQGKNGKESNALERVLLTTETQFAGSVAFLKTSVDAVGPEMLAVCNSDSDNKLIAQLCSELKTRIYSDKSASSILLLVDPENEAYSIYEGKNYISEKQERNKLKALGRKISQWVVDTLGTENVTALDGPFSQKDSLLKRSVFKSKYSKKKKKTRTRKSAAPLDEL